MDADETLDAYFEQHFDLMAHLPLDCQRHGIEAVQYQAALLPMCRMKMVENSKLHGQKAYFEVIPILHGKVAKISRIKGILRPLLWGARLTFQEKWGPLWTQFDDFPTGLLDGPDAIAMAAALLDPYVMLGLEENDNQPMPSPEADTMPPLHVVLGGNFRSAP